jgi:hypothetical protein
MRVNRFFIIIYGNQLVTFLKNVVLTLQILKETNWLPEKELV